jgi:hypothetical protein
MRDIFVKEGGDVDVYMTKDDANVEAGLEADREPQHGFLRG